MNIDDLIVDRLKAITLTDAKERAKTVLEKQAIEAWSRICEWEGRAPADPFVRVSPENPHRGRLDDVIRKANEMGVAIDVHP